MSHPESQANSIRLWLGFFESRTNLIVTDCLIRPKISQLDFMVTDREFIHHFGATFEFIFDDWEHAADHFSQWFSHKKSMQKEECK